MKKTECIVCKNELEDISGKADSFHPMDGLEFITGGHYGSTVFDPVVGNKRLRICICDVCIADGIDSGHVIGDIDQASYDHLKSDETPTDSDVKVW